MAPEPLRTPPVSSRSFRVLIAHPTWIFRAGLRSLLDPAVFTVVAEAGTGADAVADAARERPDAALVGSQLPDMSAPEVCRAMRKAAPTVVIIVLGVRGDGRAVHAALRAGARGYLLHDETIDVPDAIRRAVRGERVVDVAATASLLETLASGDADDDQVLLTPQELRILRLAAQGSTNREIGERLFLSRYTIKDHITRVMRKLGVTTRVAAVVEASRRGLLDADGSVAVDMSALRRGEGDESGS